MNRFSHRLAVLLALWFGCGRLPWAPGTWGSLGALPLGWAALQWGVGFGVLVALAVFAVGLWASSLYVRSTGGNDPAEVVIDEVAGQCLALCFAPLTPAGILAAFLLFRLFDIAKPFPIRWCERRFADGWGIMLDDVLAALYAGASLLLLRYIGAL